MTTKLNLPHIFFLAITQISYTMLYGEQKKIHTHTHTHIYIHIHTHGAFLVAQTVKNSPDPWAGTQLSN